MLGNRQSMFRLGVGLVVIGIMILSATILLAPLAATGMAPYVYAKGGFWGSFALIGGGYGMLKHRPKRDTKGGTL